MTKEQLHLRYPQPETQEFLDDFFKDFPEDLYPYLQIKNFSPGETLISSLEVSKSVFILMKGTLYAMENLVQKQPYIFTEFHPVEIVGDYELFAQMSYSYASVLSAGHSECLTLPSDLYLRWISKSPNALYIRIRFLIRQLGTQTSRDRLYFSMDYMTRCIFILIHSLPSRNSAGLSILPDTREELAGKLGCSLRSCHRIIQELASENYISLFHGKITINSHQKKLLLELFERQKNNL